MNKQEPEGMDSYLVSYINIEFEYFLFTYLQDDLNLPCKKLPTQSSFKINLYLPIIVLKSKLEATVI